MLQMLWDCDPATITAWCQRLEILGAGETTRANDVGNLAQRLTFGASLRAAMRKPVKEAHQLNTPVGPVLLSIDDQTSHVFFHRLLANGRVHEPGVVGFLCRRLRPGSIFVDVGAHTGYFACIAGRAGATVVALEMQRPLAQVIERNAAINKLERVHAMEMAAGDHEGLVRVFRYNAGLGTRVLDGTAGYAHSPSSIRHRNIDLVPITRLDTLFADRDELPDVVKIDAEGYELCVLDGARALIEQRRTAFIVEVHVGQLSLYASKHQRLIDYFPLEHWRAYDLTDKGAVAMTEAELLQLTDAAKGSQDSPNVLFEPR